MGAALLVALAVVGTGLGVWAYGSNPHAPPTERAASARPKDTGAGKTGLPAAWAGRWVANPFAGAESIQVHQRQFASGVPRVYQIKDAASVAAVVSSAKITGIRNDIFGLCMPPAELIVHYRDGSTFRASLGNAVLSCDAGMFTVDEGFITALSRAVSDDTRSPVDLLTSLPAPAGTFVKPPPPGTVKSLAAGFTSVQVTFSLGKHLHRTRFTDEKTLDALRKALAITKVEALGNDRVEVIGAELVCKDKAVVRFQFLGRETFVDNQMGKFRVTPAFVNLLNKEVSRRAGCSIDVVARNNPLPKQIERRSEELRKLILNARSLRRTEKRDGKEETIVVEDPKEVNEMLSQFSWVEAAPRELKLAKWDRSVEVVTKDGRKITLQFLHPGINSAEAEGAAGVPFLSDLVEVPGLGQFWINNQWQSRFSNLAYDRQRLAKARREEETSRLVCRDLPAFFKLVVSINSRYTQGKHQMDGLLPADEARAVLHLLGAGKFAALDWSEERWEKELTDLYDRGAAELALVPGLGYQLPLVVSGEKEMLIPMCGRISFAESPLPKLRKTLAPEKPDSVYLLPRPKGKNGRTLPGQGREEGEGARKKEVQPL
jgi:hypothetical protein